MLSSQTCCKSFPGIKWLMWVPIVFLLDQLSKWFVLYHIAVGESLKLFPGLHLIQAHNHGIAFSLFNNQAQLNQILLLLGIVLISAFVAVLLLKTAYEDKFAGVSLVLIFGGALGNLCDRIWHGYVIDFIDFYVGSWHWYTFNLADSFITIGALMMVTTIIFSKAE